MNTQSGAKQTSGTRQVLTFALGEEIYGVDILRVKEIRGWSPVTRIPQTSACVLGVLNLRGAIVPIIDLRVRLGIAAAEFTALTVVIVLSLHTAAGTRECGVVVDSVRDVVDIAPDSVRPAPEVSGDAAAASIQGIATVGEQMLILFDADSLVSGESSPLALHSAA
ncbi:MAG TPA: chemotaxis protein CheW [Steroidobacteraceae bacterium]|nr:chemotaxis protein CheW [Steroidobacteraceae bacterium]